MFLRAKTRHKDGKVHRYWSVVENRRTRNNRVVQRQVLYLGEINDSQRAVWTRAIEVFQDGQQGRKQVAIFPDDRPAPELEHEVVRIRLGSSWCSSARVSGVVAGLPASCGSSLRSMRFGRRGCRRAGRGRGG